MSDKSPLEIQRGLAESALKRQREAEGKRDGPPWPDTLLARHAAGYSGLSEREVLSFIQTGRW